jgi:hypothetical protein
MSRRWQIPDKPRFPRRRIPTRNEAVHAAEAFLKSMLSNRAAHPETYIQKVASRVGISPPALDRARASLGVALRDGRLALPPREAAGRPMSPSVIVALARDPRGMGQRKTKVPRTPAW